MFSHLRQFTQRRIQLLNQIKTFNVSFVPQRNRHVKIPTPEDLSKKEGELLKTVPAYEKILAQICGAVASFWILYMMKENGDVLFGFAPHHFEHGFGDEDSDIDDEDFNRLEANKEQVEQILEKKLDYYLGKEYDKKLYKNIENVIGKL